MKNLIYENGINVLYGEAADALVCVCKEIIGGGRIAFFGDNSTVSENCISALSAEGFSVEKGFAPPESVMNFDCVYSRQIEENCLAVVGVGGIGAVEAAKLIGARHRLPVAVVPADYAALCALKAGAQYFAAGSIVWFGDGAAQTVIIDKTLLRAAGGSSVAEGLGMLALRMVDAVDGVYEAAVTCGKCECEGVKYMMGRLSRITTENAADEVLSCLIKAEENFCGGRLPNAKSADVACHLIAKSCGGEYYRYAFTAAFALTELYRYYLADLPLEAALPPDRERSLDLLRDECGMDFHLNVKNAAAAVGDFADRHYATAEYRKDILRLIGPETFALEQLCTVYRRLQPKGGANIGQGICTERLLHLLSLTGEQVSGYPLIKHIKQTGILEPLLKCG